MRTAASKVVVFNRERVIRRRMLAAVAEADRLAEEYVLRSGLGSMAEVLDEIEGLGESPVAYAARELRDFFEGPDDDPGGRAA